MARQQRQIERVEFDAGAAEGIVARMEQLAGAGGGWINILPEIAGNDERPTSLRFFTLLSGGGSGVTMCTWVPAGDYQGRRRAPSLGITHVTGQRVAAALGQLAVPVPADWFVQQDHPRRGLVLRLPPEASAEQVLDWALRAVGVLSAPVRVTRWRGEIHLPATA